MPAPPAGSHRAADEHGAAEHGIDRGRTVSGQRSAAPGFLVTFEGVEGGGKSTQVGLLDSRLRSAGLDPFITREPGGSPLGESVRALLLDPSHAGMAPLAEL